MTRKARCLIYTGERDLTDAIADGRISEHDAEQVRAFAAFLRAQPARRMTDATQTPGEPTIAQPTPNQGAPRARPAADHPDARMPLRP